jgi:hypothetical protein
VPQVRRRAASPGCLRDHVHNFLYPDPNCNYPGHCVWQDNRCLRATERAPP